VKAPSRVPTTLAVGFLLLDAILLACAGILGSRSSLIVLAVLCTLGAVLVVVAWRRYRRAFVDVNAARQDVQRELASIKTLLQSHPPEK